MKKRPIRQGLTLWWPVAEVAAEASASSGKDAQRRRRQDCDEACRKRHAGPALAGTRRGSERYDAHFCDKPLDAHHFVQDVRAIGNDAVDTEVEEPAHVVGLVHGP